jgi:carbon monoxide dehydrogenase subunit G
MEPAILRATLPGVESVEQIAEGMYDITVAINYPSFKGRYRGRLTFSDKHYPYHYHLNLEREEGTLNGSGSVNLSVHGDTTTVAYRGTLTTNKAGGQLSQLMIKGAVKLFIQQYFLALAEQLQGVQRIQGNIERDEGNNGFIRQSSSIELETVQEHTGQQVLHPTIYSRIVSFFRLGTGDPVQEVVWEQRLRRVSIVSSLLFLVWVGTRLPRRQQTSDWDRIG